MKQPWIYGIESILVILGTLLFINTLLPSFLPDGFQACILILMLISFALLKLTSIHNNMKRKGGFL